MKAAARTALAALLVGAASLAGCAANRGAGERAPATLTVVNDMVPTGTATIRLVPTTGALPGGYMLGTLSAAEGTMEIERSLTPGEYRLVARFADGRERVSDPVTLTAGTSFRWNLGSNIVSR